MDESRKILGKFNDVVTLSTGKVIYVEVTLIKREQSNLEIFQPYVDELIRRIFAGESTDGFPRR